MIATRWLFLLIFCLPLPSAVAQTLDFSVSNEANICLNQPTVFENQSSGYTSYRWDFCAGDLGGAPTAASLGSTGSGEMRSLRTLRDDNGNWYSFAFTRTGNNLYRLSYGNSLGNTPEITNLGNLDGQFNSASGLQLVRENDIWYAIVHNGGGSFSNGTGKLVRLKFTDGLGEAPTTSEVATSVGGDFAGLDIARDGDSLVAIIANYFGNNMVLVNLGTSVTNNPSPSQIISTSAFKDFVDVDIVKYCGKWYGFALSWDDKTLYRLDFGNGNTDLFSLPTFTALKTFASRQSRLEFVEEDGELLLWIASESGSLNRLKLDAIDGAVASTDDLTNFNALNENWGLSMSKDNGKWSAIVMGLGGAIHRLDFPQTCATVTSVSTDETPTISFSEAGTYRVTLTGESADGCTGIVSKEVVVNNVAAPAIDITPDGSRCLGQSNTFTVSGSTSGTYTWDFGDGTGETGTSAQKSHTFLAPGSYTVGLQHTDAATGCLASVEADIEIFPALPSPGFDMSVEDVCTNTSISFSNNTDESNHPAGALAYDWNFNNEEQSTEKDPQVIFEATGEAFVTLTVSLPGCSAEETVNFNIASGNEVDFTFTKNCFGVPVEFTGSTSGLAVNSVSWDFGDGPTADMLSTTHQFAAGGTYDVTLNVINAGSCVTSVTKTLHVNADPVLDFTFSTATENLPVTLTGQDLSLEGDQILTWSWTYAGATFSDAQAATKTFPAAGLYPVTLNVTTQQQCEASVTRDVDVAAASEPTLALTLRDEQCRNEIISIENESVNAVSFEWDFCAGDLGRTPVVQSLSTPAYTDVRNIVVHEDNDTWYGFMVSKAGNKLYRLSFGDSLSSQPAIEDLGNVSLVMNNMTGFRISRENGTWIGIGHNGGNGNLVRISFAGGLGGNVSAEEIQLGYSTGSEYSNLDIARDGDDWVVVISDYAGHRLNVINFGNSLLNTPPSQMKSGNIAGGDFSDVSLTQWDDHWYAYAISWDGRSIYRAKFGNNGYDLDSEPVLEKLDYTFQGRAARIRCAYESGSHWLFVSMENGHLLRMAMTEAGGTISNVEDLGDFGTIAGSAGFMLQKVRSKWIGFVSGLQGELYSLVFPEPCGDGDFYSNERTPSIRFTNSGAHLISMRGSAANGVSRQLLQELIVTTTAAPGLDITVDESRCLGNVNAFTASTSSQGSFTWNFGEGQDESTTETAVNHQFGAAGEYTVQLKMTDASSGCVANTSLPIRILNPLPQPAFEVTPANRCVDSPITFLNNTNESDHPENELLYHWNFGDGQSSDEKSPVHSFAASGAGTVTLAVKLPGCELATETTIEISDNNTTAFGFQKNCVGTPAEFSGTSQGSAVSAVAWDFGDGGTSDQLETTHVFADTGVYEVRLRVTNAGQCVSEFLQEVRVNHEVFSDFSIGSAVENLPVTFDGQDLSVEGDPVVAWQWFIGESIFSETSGASRTFNMPGEYSVRLVVTSAQHCRNVIEKTFAVSVATEPTLVADLPAEVCRNEKIVLINKSVNAVAYEWDFCAGDLGRTPDVESLNANVYSDIRNIVVHRDNNHWFGFMVSKAGNKMYRVVFGDALSSQPSIEDLGNVSLSMNNITGFRLLQHDGIWIGLGHNGGSGNLVRFRFPEGLGGPVTAEEIALPYSTGSEYSNLDVAEHGGDWVVVISDYAGHRLNVINFGNSLLNTPASEMLSGNITGGDFSDVSLTQWEGRWYAYAVSWDGKSIYRATFGDDGYDLDSAPVLQKLDYTFPGRPARIRCVYEAGRHWMFVSMENGGVLRMELSNASGAIVNVEDLGDFGMTGSAGLSFHRDGSKWFAFSTDLMGRLVRLTFPEPCNIPVAHASEKDPVVHFVKTGSQLLTLRGASQNGVWRERLFAVTVSDKDAVTVDIGVNDARCLGVENAFVAEPSASAVVAWQWSFGDGSGSTDPAPTHEYASARTYQAKLDVLLQNGCRNKAFRNVTIYPKPEANFLHPGSHVCTDREIVFENTTSDEMYDDALKYTWKVDATVVSESRQLNYTFEAGGDYTVSLKAEIPGCMSEKTIDLDGVIKSPVAAFNVNGVCEQGTTAFENISEGDGLSYAWNLGPGGASTEKNPSTVYLAGEYEVQLIVTAGDGCFNELRKPVRIFALPSVDFGVLSTDLLCEGYLIHFRDQTTQSDNSVAVSWQWDLGDGAVSAEHEPTHVFETAAKYPVRLRVMTDAGCENESTREITIGTLPDAAIENTLVCNGIPVDFSSPSSEQINKWQWQIGDKSYSAMEPSHIFRNPGNYTVSLNVTGENGCIRGATKLVTVPIPLDPDFTVEKNCANEWALMQYVPDDNDPAVSWEWSILGGEPTILSGNPVTNKWLEAGDVSVRLRVKGESGCSYVVDKNIMIVPHPNAEFTMPSSIGTPPLDVQFTNNSDHADSFWWDFGNGGYSEDPQASTTYTRSGEFEITLTASNEQGCSDEVTRILTLSPPRPDVEIIGITKTENPDGSFRIMVVLENHGNTILEDLLVKIDISDKLVLEEAVQGPLMPLSRYNLMLNYNIPGFDAIRFLCASVALDDDVNADDNRSCIQFDEPTHFLPGYPNPAGRYLTIEWMTEIEGEPVTVTMVNASGNKVIRFEAVSSKGFNSKVIEVEHLQKGLYMLQLEGQFTKVYQRILLSD